MTRASDPKRTVDEFGVLQAPRFVPDLPRRIAGDTSRSTAVRALMPQIKERPGQWAAVMEADKAHACGNVVSAFRNGRFGPRSHWETAIRLNPETRRHVLYVRYLGPKPSAKGAMTA